METLILGLSTSTVSSLSSKESSYWFMIELTNPTLLYPPKQYRMDWMQNDCVNPAYLVHGSGHRDSLGLDLHPGQAAEVEQVQVFEEPVLLVSASRHHHRSQHRAEAGRVRVSRRWGCSTAFQSHALSQLPRLVYLYLCGGVRELQLLVLAAESNEVVVP